MVDPLKMLPFNRVSLTGREMEYVTQVIESGDLSGNGEFTRKNEAFLEKLLKVSKVFLTTSCTHALELIAFLLEIQPGDEVIVPSFTFVSTANAFAVRGGKPVFIDIRSDTLDLDESLLEKLITKRTKAIVVVHYAGVGCEMDTILEIAQKQEIAVIEDNAHGLLGKYRGQYLGSFGRMAALSFHETKNFTCGEGGALILQDPKLIERAEILREKGTNRRKFFRGEVDKYTWVDQGSNYLPSEIQAAFLYAQLEAKDRVLNRRREIWNLYRGELEGWSVENGVRLPIVPSHCEQSYHMFYLLMASLSQRESFVDHLKTRGIVGVFHYQPLHVSMMGKKLAGKAASCPVTEEISDRLLRLPFFNNLNLSDQMYIIQCIKEFKWSA